MFYYINENLNRRLTGTGAYKDNSRCYETAEDQHVVHFTVVGKE